MGVLKKYVLEKWQLYNHGQSNPMNDKTNR